jgi:hypothetical protein
METFSVDKSFYDIGTSDLKELWDSDLDPVSVMLWIVCKVVNIRKTIKEVCVYDFELSLLVCVLSNYRN